ncbi:MAG: hypothetical protein J6J43_06845 [Oscillospiraceae bacterium]|nr:hypothetical protein [Oscillospiraceae bacterium]
MNKKVLWITETALMLALLIALQYLTKGFGQMVTGSCVNAILAICVLVAGLGSGFTVALISPVAAFLLGIAPQVLVVPAIMLGNTVFVALLHLIAKKSIVSRVLAWIVAAACKFAVLYLVVAQLVCGVLAEPLLAQGLLKQPMLQALPATFGIAQFVTALIGGAVGLLIAPTLKKALKK